MVEYSGGLSDGRRRGEDVLIG
jgi:hypothetical protein